MSRKFSFASLKKAIRNPYLFLWEIDRLLIRRIKSTVFEYRYGPGIDVMQQDWDNLILLDALRYDYFESEINFDGTLTPVISRGAHSWEFMKENFVGNEYHDTIYVTANPHVHRLPEDIFFTVNSLSNRWGQNLGTIHPNEVVKAAKLTHKRHPNKKLIIHFMQPHQPFLGKTADAIRENFDIKGYDINLHRDVDKRTGISWWELVKENEISLEETQQAYRETLEIALGHVQDLMSTLGGKSVISADHGEMLGERGVLKKRFAHPHDIYNEELRIVPWFEPPHDSRRDAVTDKPIGYDGLDSETANQRLKALGYQPK